MEPEDIETKKYQLFDETIKSDSQASSSLRGSTLPFSLIESQHKNEEDESHYFYYPIEDSVKKSFNLFHDMNPHNLERFKKMSTAISYVDGLEAEQIEAIKENKESQHEIIRSESQLNMPLDSLVSAEQLIVTQPSTSSSLRRSSTSSLIEKQSAKYKLDWSELNFCTKPVTLFSSQRRKKTSEQRPKVAQKSVASTSQPVLSVVVEERPKVAEASVASTSQPVLSSIVVEERPEVAQASVASTSQLVLSSIVVEVAQASVASTSQPVLSSEVVGEASEVVGEASESEEESKKTLNKTIELYLRSFHKFRGLRLEQIRNDKLSPKEEEDQKKRVDDVQKEMVAAIKDVRLKSGNKETLAKNLRDLKKGIQKLEDDCFKINQEKESAEKETAQKKAEKEK